MEDLQPGQMLGPYRIEAEIGKGGMAMVYKAYQTTMDRYVAIKVLTHQFAQDKGFLERFSREVRTVSKLEHPHILAVYDYGEIKESITTDTEETAHVLVEREKVGWVGTVSGTPYLVMRYLEGGTLKEYIHAKLTALEESSSLEEATRDKVRTLSLEDIDRIFTQMADALEYAHDQGVIHRDVKPTNILVDKRGNAFLTDFGIAKLVEAGATLTPSGAITGTPTYMSPEQAQGLKLDQRTDVYSLGVVLYEMLTGRVPYEAKTPVTLIQKKLDEPPPLPTSINPDIHPAIEAVLLRALTKEPADRFASMRQFKDAWKSALAIRAESIPTKRQPVAVKRGVGALDESLTYDTAVEEVAAQSRSYQAGAPRRTPPPQQTPSRPTQGIPFWAILAGLAAFLCLIAVGGGALILGGRYLLNRTQMDATAQALSVVTPAMTLVETPLATEEPVFGLTAVPTLPSPITALPTLAETEMVETAVATAVETTAGGGLIFGPDKGSWSHQVGGKPQVLETDLDVTDFYAELTFTNPYSTAIGNWDVGLLFRAEDVGKGYLLQIRSNKTWTFYQRKDGNNVELEKGTAENLNDTAGKTNKVVLLVLGDRGYFFLNNYFSGGFYISDADRSGKVIAGIGFAPDSQLKGYATSYRDFGVWSLPKVFGPAEGSFEHTVDQELKREYAGLSLQNFVARASFHNPYIPSKGKFNMGYCFRSLSEEDEYRVFVASDTSWRLGNKIPRLNYTSWLKQGKGMKLDLSVDGWNEVLLVVLGDRGLIYVNGSYVTWLDLTARMNSGDIAIGEGFLGKDNIIDEVKGYFTEYQDFTIWALP